MSNHPIIISNMFKEIIHQDDVHMYTCISMYVHKYIINFLYIGYMFTLIYFTVSGYKMEFI